ncbi:MAG: hypothetical protein AAF411_24435 [Myxococcota bacterium]
MNDLQGALDAADPFAQVRENLDAMQALDLEGLSPQASLERIAVGLRLAQEALAAHPRSGVSPLAVLVQLEAAWLRAETARVRRDDDAEFKAHMEDALMRIDRALIAAQGLPAPLVEVRGLCMRGVILANLGQPESALSHMDEVIAVLGPHVAAMEEQAARIGPEAAALLDRHIHARDLLADARKARQELAPMVAAMRDVATELEAALDAASQSSDPRGTFERMLADGEEDDLSAALPPIVVGLVLAVLLASASFLLLSGWMKWSGVAIAGLVVFLCISAMLPTNEV